MKFWKNGSRSSLEFRGRRIPKAEAIAACITDDEIVVWLRDGREVHTPLYHSERLSHALPWQRQKFELLGGIGIHWPAIDEDLSVDGLILEAQTIKTLCNLKRKRA